MAETPEEHIQVTEETKERLRRRKGENENFDDVLRRLLDDDRSLLAGFGAATDRTGEMMTETVARRSERPLRRNDEDDEGSNENRL